MNCAAGVRVSVKTEEIDTKRVALTFLSITPIVPARSACASAHVIL